MGTSINKIIVEFIGAFFLVFTVGATSIGFVALRERDALLFAPLAIGSVLMVMIFAGGHISGGHFNPAVSLAVFLRGKCSLSDLISFSVAQVAAAIVASFLILYLKGFPTVPTISPDPIKALIVEFLFTFALCWVVLNAATSRATSGNSFYGLAIGFTVLAGAYSVGDISGGAFNPAVAVGITIMGISPLANIWIYLVACLAAGAVAAYAFRFLSTDDAAPELVDAAPNQAARPAPSGSPEAARRRRR